VKSTKTRILRAIRAGWIVRMDGTSAVEMDDFSLANFLVKQYPQETLEFWLSNVQRGKKSYVSGDPPLPVKDAKNFLAKLRAYAAANGKELFIQPTGAGGYAIGIEVGTGDWNECKGDE
jgi:hypothetical protein